MRKRGRGRENGRKNENENTGKPPPLPPPHFFMIQWLAISHSCCRRTRRIGRGLFLSLSCTLLGASLSKIHSLWTFSHSIGSKCSVCMYFEL